MENIELYHSEITKSQPKGPKISNAIDDRALQTYIYKDKDVPRYSCMSGHALLSFRRTLMQNVQF